MVAICSTPCRCFAIDSGRWWILSLLLLPWQFVQESYQRSWTCVIWRNYDGQDKVRISLNMCCWGSIKAGASHNVVGNVVNCLKPKVLRSGWLYGVLQCSLRSVGSYSTWGQGKVGDVVISGKLSAVGDKQIIDDREQWWGNTVNASKNIKDLYSTLDTCTGSPWYCLNRI